MGRKRTRKRKHLLFYVACCVTLLFASWGCVHAPKTREVQGRLAGAETLLAAGQYWASLAETNEVLELYPQTLRGEALFQKGLIYASPKNPERDYKKSIELFETVVKEFPQSDARGGANACVLFVQQIMDIEKEIGELKKANGRLGKALKEQKRRTKKLRAKADKLKRVLLKLKEVDLGVHEKKSSIK